MHDLNNNLYNQLIRWMIPWVLGITFQPFSGQGRDLRFDFDSLFRCLIHGAGMCFAMRRRNPFHNATLLHVISRVDLTSALNEGHFSMPRGLI